MTDRRQPEILFGQRVALGERDFRMSLPDGRGTTDLPGASPPPKSEGLMMRS